MMIGCGGKERTEAVGLAKVLTSKKADFDKANAAEKSLIASARAWSGGIVENGAGRGAELDQNAAVATELAKNASETSTQLGLVRQAVYDLPLKEEFTGSVRSTLITEITRRQRFLQDVRSLLQASVPDFQAYKLKKGFAGDAYPGSIGKLQGLIQNRSAPQDAVAEALESLKTKYSLTAGEM
jgi:hypothetical protein